MAKKIVLNWNRPTVRADNTPLPAEKIAEYVVELSADNGANFVEMDRVEAPTTTFEQTEADDGYYVLRVAAVNVHGLQGAWATVGITVGDVVVPPDNLDLTVPPGAPTGLVATVEEE